MRWGMEKLVQRETILPFLKPMLEMGFFNPIENPGPVQGDAQGTYRIARWEPLIYLEKAAIEAGNHDDLDAARTIVEVMRSATEYAANQGQPVDNPSTWRSFATIISALPTKSYSARDLQMLRVWLESKFDRGMMIGVVLGKELLPKLLASEDSQDLEKARLVIAEASRLVWRANPTAIGEKDEAVTAVDPYWLRKLFEKHSKALGEKCGPHVIELLNERVSELFSKTGEDKHSWLLRPAVEDHSQNHDFRHTYNVLINALRDTLLAYVDARPSEGRELVQRVMSSSLDITKRIGIHIIDERFQILSNLFLSRLDETLKLPLIHEIYRLLKRHFHLMSQSAQESVLDAINRLNVGTDESLRLQSRLVHAIRGKGNASVEALYQQLGNVANWDREDMHPDFLSYMTSWSGSGPSPYSMEELKPLDDAGLIQTLNAYEEPKGWHGPRVPTMKALCDALTQLVKDDPQRFTSLLPGLMDLKPAYQYAVLNGFRDLSHSGTQTDQTRGIQWPQVWKQLFQYLSTAMLAEALRPTADEPVVETLTPTRNWLIPVIADLIRNGTHDDYRAIPSELFSELHSVIAYLLLHEKSTAEGRANDAMTEAINTSKGRCIEALFDVALYVCRYEDRLRKIHANKWKEFENLFDREIAQCKGDNFEFSTLCGAYLASIQYLSAAWLDKHIENIFPKDFAYSRNFDCALQGFAYMPQPTRATYALMRGRGILHSAIARPTEGRHAREKLIQHVSVAYLWGDEPLERADSLTRLLVEQMSASDIQEIVRFFWGLHSDELKPEHLNKILEFWRACMSRIRGVDHEYRELLSDLGLLTVFLEEISDEHETWLLRIAPSIGANHNTDFFVEYLDKLAEVSPRQVGEITLAVVRNERPYFDFENRYESIIRKLMETTYHQLAAELCNQPGLMDLPQITAIYNEYRKNRRGVAKT